MAGSARGAVGRVQVLASSHKPGVVALLPTLTAWLRERAADVAVSEDALEFARQRARMPAGVRGPSPDLVVVLGGDGAMLAAAHAYADDPVPTLGINFGRVGFLAACAASHWESALEGILAGQGVLEPRMRLAVSLERNGDVQQACALNEVVVGRGAHQGMLSASLFVGDDWVMDVRADAVIVATPSGSTAYSLAAGGPILTPSMEGLIVTPVASQGLANRPIVLSPDSDVRLTVARAGGLVTGVVDGRDYRPLHQGDSVLVRRHALPYPLYSMPGLDPYRRLRSRLGWGAGPRPAAESEDGDRDPPAEDVTAE